jgi:snurportin-1
MLSSFTIVLIVWVVIWQPDKTYYVVDMMCWRGYSLYDCSAEFRFFWMTTKLAETGALNPPTAHHRYRFSVVPVFECNAASLEAVYTGSVAFVRDGLLFVNRSPLSLFPLSLCNVPT